MHQNIQLIRIRVDWPEICEHIGGPSPTICGLFLYCFMALDEAIASRAAIVIVSWSEGRTNGQLERLAQDWDEGIFFALPVPPGRVNAFINRLIKAKSTRKANKLWD